MLQTKAVSPPLYGLLKKLFLYPGFAKLRLVGGTSLALQLGHRLSKDIDLFGEIEFKKEDELYLKSLGECKILKNSRHINIVSINGIKVDIVNYRYPWIGDPINFENIQLASKKDIAAMKYNAISGRGSKKDFIDLYYLLNEFSFEDMFRFYVDKYDDGNPWLVKKSLLYFNEADEQTTPHIFDEITWDEIKRNIISKYKEEGYI